MKTVKLRTLAGELTSVTASKFLGNLRRADAKNDKIVIEGTPYQLSSADLGENNWKVPADVMAIDNVADLTGLQTIDDEDGAADLKVFLANQTNKTQNGLWLMQEDAWTRPENFEAGRDVSGAIVIILKGTAHADSAWELTTDDAIVDTSELTFVPFGGVLIKEIAYADFGTIMSSKAIVQGQKYLITDRCDNGLLVTGATTTTTELAAVGYFSNPDYQNVGDYSDITTDNGFAVNATGGNKGIWTPALTVTAGNVVIYNGDHYLNKTGAVGTAPDGDGTNWQKVARFSGVNRGYVIEADYVEYDFTNDWLQRRLDKRQNDFSYTKLADAYYFSLGESQIPKLQWGNNLCRLNKIVDSRVDSSVTNFPGGIVANQLYAGSNIQNISYDAAATLDDGTLSENVLYGGSAISDITFKGTNSQLGYTILDEAFIFNKTITSCLVGSLHLTGVQWDDIREFTTNYQNKQADRLASNLDIIIDFQNTDHFADSEIKIPCNAYGIFAMTSTNGTETANKINGLRPAYKSKFVPETGLAVTFTKTAFAGGLSGSNKIGYTKITDNTVDTCDGTNFDYFEITRDRGNTFNLVVNTVNAQ